MVLLLDEFPTLSLLDANGRIDGRRLPNFARLARIHVVPERDGRRHAHAVRHAGGDDRAVSEGARERRADLRRVPRLDLPPAGRRVPGERLGGGDEALRAVVLPPAAVVAGREHSAEGSEGGTQRTAHACRGQYEQMVALHDSQRLAEGDAVEQIGATRDDDNAVR